MPKFILLGGPNGVGKSTFTDNILYPEIPIINGDRIKLTHRKEGKPMHGFDLALKIKNEINRFEKQYSSFGIESNLNTPLKYNITDRLKQKGYEIDLIYIGIKDVKLLNDRIAERVKLGEHYIPPKEVKQRYEDSLKLLPGKIRSFDQVEIYDNTDINNTTLLMRFEKGKLTFQKNKLPKWAEEVYQKFEKDKRLYEKIEKLKGKSGGISL